MLSDGIGVGSGINRNMGKCDDGEEGKKEEDNAETQRAQRFAEKRDPSTAACVRRGPSLGTTTLFGAGREELRRSKDRPLLAGDVMGQGRTPQTFLCRLAMENLVGVAGDCLYG
jgi:hypothetical protein